MKKNISGITSWCISDTISHITLDDELIINFPTVAKLSNFKRNFPTSLGSFQFQSVLSNFAWLFPTSAKLSNFNQFFPTSIGSFQLRSVLSNFAWLFPISAELFNFGPSNFLFFPTTRIPSFSLHSTGVHVCIHMCTLF